jgi:FAD synthetase
MAEEEGKSEKREKKRKVVLASGTFDLLHLGHVRFLEEAKKAGGKNAKLIVIVARDSTVEKRKGSKPVMSENQRRALVEALKVVDEAILGYEDFNIGRAIEKIKPDVIAVGHDSHLTGMEQAVKEYIEEKGLNIKIVKIGKFSEDELDSSSKIKQKIIEHYRRREE